MLKFVDVEGVKNQMKQQVMFWDLRVYYHSEENVKRLNAAKDPGEFSVPSSREKYDLIQRLRDNVSWERCDLKFSGEVGPEAQGKRNAAGRMYSLLRSWSVPEVNIKAEYKRFVDFYLMDPSDRGGHGKLFASWLGATSGWQLFGDVWKEMGVDMPVDDLVVRLKADL